MTPTTTQESCGSMYGLDGRMFGDLRRSMALHGLVGWCLVGRRGKKGGLEDCLDRRVPDPINYHVP